MGKLPKEKYRTAQEFADDIARNLMIPTPIGESGPQGQGSIVSVTAHTIAVAAGERFVVAPFDATGCIVNLLNSEDETPTMAISCIHGSKIKFTQAAPTANYSVLVKRYTIEQ